MLLFLSQRKCEVEFRLEEPILTCNKSYAALFREKRIISHRSDFFHNIRILPQQNISVDLKPLLAFHKRVKARNLLREVCITVEKKRVECLPNIRFRFNINPHKTNLRNVLSLHCLQLDAERFCPFEDLLELQSYSLHDLVVFDQLLILQPTAKAILFLCFTDCQKYRSNGDKTANQGLPSVDEALQRVFATGGVNPWSFDKRLAPEDNDHQQRHDGEIDKKERFVPVFKFHRAVPRCNFNLPSFCTISKGAA